MDWEYFAPGGWNLEFYLDSKNGAIVGCISPREWNYCNSESRVTYNDSKSGNSHSLLEEVWVTLAGQTSSASKSLASEQELSNYQNSHSEWTQWREPRLIRAQGSANVRCEKSTHCLKYAPTQEMHCLKRCTIQDTQIASEIGIVDRSHGESLAGLPEALCSKHAVTKQTFFETWPQPCTAFSCS